MSQKYSDARYPEKINDLIDNEGGLSEEGKSTINESVKEAIEGGDIPIPAGGIKIYKHTVRVQTISGSHYGSEIVFYSTDNTPVDSLEDYVRTCGSFCGGSPHYYTTAGGSYPGDHKSRLVLCGDQVTITPFYNTAVAYYNTPLFFPAPNQYDTKFSFIHFVYSTLKAEIYQFDTINVETGQVTRTKISDIDLSLYEFVKDTVTEL